MKDSTIRTENGTITEEVECVGIRFMRDDRASVMFGPIPEREASDDEQEDDGSSLVSLSDFYGGSYEWFMSHEEADLYVVSERYRLTLTRIN